jgi:hypothetical protein
MSTALAVFVVAVLAIAGRMLGTAALRALRQYVRGLWPH